MTAVFGISLAPSGRAFVDAAAPDATAIDAALAKRVERAFARGTGAGVLQLGACEQDGALPPSAAWFRELGRRFMAALCATADLEDLRERAPVPATDRELAELVAAAPPMRGGENLSVDVARTLWAAVERAAHDEIAAFDGAVQAWLHAKSPAWHRVGRIVLHLAENKRDAGRPFAFLATYTARLSKQGTVQHVPLGRAIEESADARDRRKLLALLEPVMRAAESSPVLKRLLDSRDLYHPLAWKAPEAYAFLKEVPALEAAGVVVRVPDWWRARRRPVVTATIGSKRPGGLALDALLDFRVDVTLDGEALDPDDLAELARSTAGLALVRGQWVEVDPARLDHALSRWKAAQRAAQDGVSFHEAMRLLAAADPQSDVARAGPAPEETRWVAVDAGPWLRKVLDGLRSPDGLAAATPGKALRATLRPYQELGVRWLWTLHELGLGGCLADDMGLGKTVQVIALLLLRRKHKAKGRALLVVPASLIANWQSELARFAPDLDEQDVVVTSYGRAGRLGAEQWGLVVLDEAQAIKNPSAKQTRTVKAITAARRLALTGTPIENRLGDLWSIFDFTSPGLLGSQKAFAGFVKQLERRTPPDYAPLRNLVAPYVLRRLKTDRSVITDLPDKTEMIAWCGLSKLQIALYQEAVADLARDLERTDAMKRRGLVLASLLRMKQIVNSPSQWLRDGAWEEKQSGKLQRLRELCEPIAARQEKALVFTQFRETTEPLAAHLASVFGRDGLVLHGGTAVKRRGALVDSFQRDDGPPFFVLSLKAGGSGLNLTAASHVVHFDRWWNPAVENQATDRAFRIGQKKNVMVHKLVCRGTLEERIDALIASKRALAEQVLAPGSEVALTELSNDEILRLVALDMDHAAAGS